MKVAVLGASGMLGSTAFRLLSREPGLSVIGTVRAAASTCHFAQEMRANIHAGVDAESPDGLVRFLQITRPDVVINCVGIVKQLTTADDPLVAIPINAILPHRLASLCGLSGTRLVHISTDCVFSGKKGNYVETDLPDADDLYGRSKLLGEVDYPNALTLRTSIIGRELASRNGLVEWFLGAGDHVRGFTRTIFSGLTTDEFTRVILRYVLPNSALRGTYHVSTAPIDKFSLLTMLRDAYGLPTVIEPDDRIVIDRSLDSTRFRQMTGYSPPSWPALIDAMRINQDLAANRDSR